MEDTNYLNIDNIAIPVPATPALTLEQPSQTSFVGVVNRLPTPTPAGIPVNGKRDHNFIDEVYNQIWVMDKTYDVGYITQDYKTTIEVWNAYYVPKTLASISFDASQIDINTALSLPFIMKGNSSETFDLTVYADGSSSINTNFTFTFSDQLIVGNVTGTRAIIFDMPHNWETAFVENFTCFTDIIKSIDLSEQRFSNGQDPRYTCSYFYTLKDTDKQKFDALIYNIVDDVVNIPLEVYNVRLAESVPVGQEFIIIDEVVGTIMQKDLQLRITQRGETEIVEILSVVGNRLNIKKPITKSFNAHAVATPVILGRLLTVEKGGVNTNIGNYKVTFEKNIDTIEMLKTNSTERSGTIDGIKYMNIAPNEDLNVATSYNNSKVVLTNEYGLRKYYKYSDINEVAFEFDYIAVDKELNKNKLSLLKNDFNDQQGMWNDLYMNNYSGDITIIKTILPSDTIIQIKNINASSLIKGKKIKYIAIKHGHQTSVFEISDIYAYDATTEYIVLPSNAGVTINLNAINYSSFVFRGRLNSDTLSFEYRTGDIVRTNIAFLKNIDVE